MMGDDGGNQYNLALQPGRSAGASLSRPGRGTLPGHPVGRLEQSASRTRDPDPRQSGTIVASRAAAVSLRHRSWRRGILSYCLSPMPVRSEQGSRAGKLAAGRAAATSGQDRGATRVSSAYFGRFPFPYLGCRPGISGNDAQSCGTGPGSQLSRNHHRRSRPGPRGRRPGTEFPRSPGRTVPAAFVTPGSSPRGSAWSPPGRGCPGE